MGLIIYNYKKKDIFFMFFIFHFEISGSAFIFVHSLNTQLILFHLDKSGSEINEIHS